MCIYENNYSPETQLIFFNNPLDFVSGIIQQHELLLQRIIVKNNLEQKIVSLLPYLYLTYRKLQSSKLEIFWLNWLKLHN